MQALPPVTAAAAAPTAAEPLYEALASVNVRVLIAGHDVQWTLRGTSEAHVFARLDALLRRPDVRPLPPRHPKPQWKQRQPQGRH